MKAPIIQRRWTTKAGGFLYWFRLKGQNSPRFPTLEDAQAGRTAAMRNLTDPENIIRD